MEASPKLYDDTFDLNDPKLCPLLGQPASGYVEIIKRLNPPESAVGTTTSSGSSFGEYCAIIEVLRSAASTLVPIAIDLLKMSYVFPPWHERFCLSARVSIAEFIGTVGAPSGAGFDEIVGLLDDSSAGLIARSKIGRYGERASVHIERILRATPRMHLGTTVQLFRNSGPWLLELAKRLDDEGFSEEYKAQGKKPLSYIVADQMKQHQQLVEAGKAI